MTPSRVAAPENGLELNGGAIRVGPTDAFLAHDLVASGYRVSAFRPYPALSYALPAPKVDADLDGTADTFTAETGNNQVKVWVGFGNT